MYKTQSHFARLATGSLWVFTLGVWFSLVNLASASDVDSNQAKNMLPACDPAFGDAIEYDTGEQTTLAGNSSGLFIEFHKTESLSDYTIWYHLGRSNGGMLWGGSQISGVSGFWPTAAISSDGYVILVYSEHRHKNACYLYYRVGKVDPLGSLDQSIQWLTDSIYWDRGFHSSIAINDNGLIVSVHETGFASTGIYYRVGHFANPGAGDFTIQWDSGQWGVWYDDGINPHIAINNYGQVVEVHQVPGEYLLHYWRGTVRNGQIQFVASRRYNDDARQPAVVLLDSGVVVEAHVDGSGSEIIVTSGMLSPDDPATIEWGSAVGLNGDHWGNLSYPAIATDGTQLAVTFSDWAMARYLLKHSVGKICHINGTLISGTGDNLYVVLDNYRHWIPNEVTFDAIGFKWDDILSFSDNVVNVIPEGNSFPSVASLSGPLKYPNGTLARGSAGKVYVVLNNHRHWIPDEATFEAMGYKWREIRQLRDNVLQAIPEMAPFPSVAR